jgi:hypothetical protein
MHPDVCPEHKDSFLELHRKLDVIIERLGRGDVTFATTVLRVDQIEKVVYGAMALALTAVGGAVLSLVIRTH